MTLKGTDVLGKSCHSVWLKTSLFRIFGSSPVMVLHWRNSCCTDFVEESDAHAHITDYRLGESQHVVTKAAQLWSRPQGL